MYNSKYYTCEQIDQRLLDGYYDDAVAAGYTGTKAQYLAGLLKAINYSANPTLMADNVIYDPSSSGLGSKNVKAALDELVRKFSGGLADGAVTKDKLATGSVTSEKIAEGAITKDKLSPETWLPLNRGRKSDGTFVDDSITMGYNSEATSSQSSAIGYECKAKGNTSHAEGYSTTASGDTSHAEGSTTQAEGNRSHAEGSITYAKGDTSHAEGYYCRATGDTSHAEGFQTKAVGYYSHSEGRETIASGWSSHVEGYKTETSGNYSHAEGQSTEATGESSHAEGNSTIASGNEAHAEGYKTEAKGNRSHSEGQSTKAEGNNSHAEGYSTTASGNYSHAEGNNNLAKGFCSHAEGKDTSAIGNYSHAQGVYNYAANDFLHMIGIGNEDYRKNACVIYVKRGSGGIPDLSDKKTGYMYLLGVGDYDGQNITDYMKSVQEVLAEYSNIIEDMSIFRRGTGELSSLVGRSTKAEGTCSHAEGEYTIAQGYCSHAQGCSNYSNVNFIDTVGIGDELNYRLNASVIYVGRRDMGRIDYEDSKTGYQYLLGVGGYRGKEIGDAKSVQEVFADLTSRIEALEAKLADTTAEEDKQTN